MADATRRTDIWITRSLPELSSGETTRVSLDDKHLLSQFAVFDTPNTARAVHASPWKTSFFCVFVLKHDIHLWIQVAPSPGLTCLLAFYFLFPLTLASKEDIAIVNSSVICSHIMQNCCSYCKLEYLRGYFEGTPGGTQLSFWYRCAARRATNGGLKNR